MKVNTIQDSVHQINTAGLALIKEADGLQYTDVAIAAVLLNRKLRELLDLFDTSPDAYAELAVKKQEAEAAGIRLQTLMCLQANKHKDIIELRNFAHKLYEDVRVVFTRCTKSKLQVSDRVIAEWGYLCNWALKFDVASKHLVFELDSEDEAKIKEITTALTGFYEKYGRE